jgi:hypothetical protein
MPGGEAGVYTMLRLGGDDVAALYPARAEQPTAWLSYVTVEEVDATARRAMYAGAVDD